MLVFGPLKVRYSEAWIQEDLLNPNYEGILSVG